MDIFGLDENTFLFVPGFEPTPVQFPPLINAPPPKHSGDPIWKGTNTFPFFQKGFEFFGKLFLMINFIFVIQQIHVLMRIVFLWTWIATEALKEKPGNRLMEVIAAAVMADY